MIKRDDAFKSVVKFETPIIVDGEIKSNIGTGFFVSPTPQKLYLITASHVAKNLSEATLVYFSGKNGTIKQLLKDIKHNNPIINHQNADVSAIEINIAVFNSLTADCVIYPTSIIDKPKVANLSRDSELTSIGFPNGLGISLKFEPLTFRSYAASNIIKNVSIDGGYVSDVFFLENAGCGGYSGCPVIDLGYRVDGLMTQTSNTFIYGIMHGTMSDATGGKMAVVTPAYYILDII